uniref:SUEL-type lectin domain-containing protein n=1 Tax=Sinocyclocheilus anshuiensis TaxID=1608454 RepID=A0A671S742_9TELE
THSLSLFYICYIYVFVFLIALQHFYIFTVGLGSSLICEHATSALTCGVTCSTGQPASQLAKTDCYTLNSQTVVTRKNSCSILASNSVFSDPCVGTIKYLYISYSCRPRGLQQI